MGRGQFESSVSTEVKSNRLIVTFKGKITKSELESVYTDVRFGVADLQPEFQVISDFTECRLMYLNGLPTFRKIVNYILSSQCGEIVRVIDSKRLISKQIINLTLRRQGYKPIYVSTVEEAEEKLNESIKRDGLRIHLHQQPVEVVVDEKKYTGHILNISTSGCAITIPSEPPAMRSMVQVSFGFNESPDAEKFNFDAEVVRVESYTFAVRFLDLDSRRKALLWKCLIDESGKEIVDV